MREPTRFLAVTFNPTFQKTLVLKNLQVNEVNRTAEYLLTLAGKGLNTTRMLTQLGQQARHLTHLGGRQKELFLSLAAGEGLPMLWVESESEIRTCTTLIDLVSRTTTEIVEEPPAVAPGTQERARAAYAGALPHCDAVIFSGTNAPGYDEEMVPRMVRDARAAEKMVILDIKGSALLESLPFRPDIIKPNFSEFLKTFAPGAEQGEHSIGADALEFVREQMVSLYRRWGTVSVITSGANPTLFIDDGVPRELPVHQIKPLNTIGSGDAFTAGLAAVLGAGGTVEEAVRKGQECGARNAELLVPGTIISS